MINIEKHLTNFLYEQDFFIVPGLGAFIAAFSQASISDSGDLIAPFKTFDFNGLLNADDTHKFLNYIVGKENSAAAEVESQLKDFVFNFKSGLSTNKKMVLAGVCSISRTDQDLLVGTFDASQNYYNKPDFVNQNAAPVLESVAETLTETEEEIEYDEEYEYEEEGINWLKYLMYLIPIALVLWALWYMMFKKPFENNESVISDVAEIEMPFVDSTSSALNADLQGEENSNDSSTAINNNAPEAISNAAAKEVVYQVAAGIFKSRTNADNLMARMQTAGFDAKIKRINGMRRVYVGVSSMDEAEAMSKRIEKFTGEKSVYFDKDGISNR